MIKKAWIKLRIGVTCEGCGHEYTYSHDISETGGGMSDVQGRVHRRLREREYGVRRCPECKYLQSWMQEHWRKTMKEIAVFLALACFVALGILIGWPWPQNRSTKEMGDRLVLFLAGGGYGLLLVGSITGFQFLARPLLNAPNRRWRKKNGDKPVTACPPVVTVVH
jgi:hypothetical protein